MLKYQLVLEKQVQVFYVLLRTIVPTLALILLQFI